MALTEQNKCLGFYPSEKQAITVMAITSLPFSIDTAITTKLEMGKVQFSWLLAKEKVPSYCLPLLSGYYSENKLG